MKKLVFTAIAVIAFSGIGMAKTFPKKQIFIVVSEKSQIEKTATGIPKEFISTLTECFRVYTEVRNAYSAVVGVQQATAIAQGAFAGCMGDI